MSYHGNFTRVTLVHNDPDTGGDALVIDGKSREPERVEYIHVAVPHHGRLLTVSVPNAAGSKDWVATFPQGERFDLGDTVCVVGVAVLHPPDDPFVWSDTLATTSRTDPP
jgi:hypothetical protein